jgi:hypothetical protein
MNRWILARNCSLEAKLLRRSSLRTRMENQISIWLSQEACLGVKWKTMRWVGSRRNASRVFLEASTPDLPLTPSVRLRPQWRATNRTTDSGEVDIEVVADDVPSRAGGGAAQQVVEKSCEVVLAAGVADHALDLAGGDVEGGDQHLSAMTAVFELMPLELAGHHGQVWRDPLQGLDAGLLDRWTPCGGSHRRRPQPCRPRRYQRTWHQRPDRAWGSASSGFVEGLNNKIRVIQRRAYGLRDENYLRLKILTCMLPRL